MRAPARVAVDADSLGGEEPARRLQRGALHRVAEQLAVDEHQLLAAREHEARLLGHLLG